MSNALVGLILTIAIIASMTLLALEHAIDGQAAIAIISSITGGGIAVVHGVSQKPPS